tara:strand:+ start:57 stop:620 length:564 start_codon:yes stop_codon:yes gene_type:complete
MSLNLFMFFVFIFGCVSVISAIVDGHTGLETTTLTAAVTESDTTIYVKTTDPFVNEGVIMIGDETICYTDKTSTTFTGVTRGEDCRSTSRAQAFPVNQQVMSEAPGVINTLVGFDITSAFADGGFIGLAKGIYTSAKNLPSFLNAVARMIVWDYSFLDGPFVYIKFLVLYPLSAGMVLSFVRLALGR